MGASSVASVGGASDVSKPVVFNITGLQNQNEKFKDMVTPAQMQEKKPFESSAKECTEPEQLGYKYISIKFHSYKVFNFIMNGIKTSVTHIFPVREIISHQMHNMYRGGGGGPCLRFTGN